jgi:hypothetical protein
MTASQIMKASAKVLVAEKTFLVKGSIKEGSSVLDLDLESSASGSASQGTITSSAKSGGFVGSLRFVDVDKVSYFNAPGSVWSQFITSGSGLTAAQATKIVNAFKGKWVELGAADAKSLESGLGDLTDPKTFASQLLTDNGSLTKGKPTTVRGEQALPITSSKGGTLYIALEGPPLPLKLAGSDAGTSAAIAFGYPSKLVVVAPPHPVTLTQIEQSITG